jgi:hypothetical protein
MASRCARASASARSSPIESALERQRAGTIEQLLQRSSADVVYDDPRTIGFLEHGDDADDVRVRRGAQQRAFPLDRRDRIRIVGERRAQSLHGDDAIVAVVHRRMDVAHPSRTDQVRDLEAIREKHWEVSGGRHATIKWRRGEVETCIWRRKERRSRRR